MKWLLRLAVLTVLLPFIPSATAQDSQPSIRQIDWHPNGTQMLILYEDGSLELRDLETNTITYSLSVQYANAVQFSPDGTHFAALHFSTGLEIFETDSGHVTTSIPTEPDRYFNDFDWSPSGSYVAGLVSNGSGGAAWYWVDIWDVETGQLFTSYDTGQPAAITWSPDGRYLVLTAYYYGTPTTILDLYTGNRVGALGNYGGGVYVAEWSPDTTHLATADGNGHVWIWDFPSRELIWQFETALDGFYSEQVVDLNWSPDGRLVATASLGDGLDIWDTITGRALAIDVPPDSLISTIAFSPDGQQIAFAEYGSNELTILDTPPIVDETPVRELTAFSWNPDSTSIAIAYFHDLEIWDIDADTYTPLSTALPIFDVAWSANGEQLAVNTGFTDSAIRIMDQDGNERQVFRSQHNGHRIRFPTWSPDGQSIAASVTQYDYRNTSDIHWIEVWDISTGSSQAHNDWGGDFMQWSPDGNYVASAYSGNLRVSSYNSDESFSDYVNYASDWDWSPDSSILAYSTALSIEFYGIAEQSGVPFRIHETEANAVAWHPDGCLLATLTDTHLKFWDIVTGQPLYAQVADGSIGLMDWSSDGTILAYSDGHSVELLHFAEMDIAVPECVYDWR